MRCCEKKKEERVDKVETFVKETCKSYYLRKNYETLTLILIPNEKSYRDASFYIDCVAEKVIFEFNINNEPTFGEQLKKDGFKKRKNYIKVMFESFEKFASFIEQYRDYFDKK